MTFADMSTCEMSLADKLAYTLCVPVYRNTVDSELRPLSDVLMRRSMRVD